MSKAQTPRQSYERIPQVAETAAAVSEAGPEKSGSDLATISAAGNMLVELGMAEDDAAAAVGKGLFEARNASAEQIWLFSAELQLAEAIHGLQSGIKTPEERDRFEVASLGYADSVRASTKELIDHLQVEGHTAKEIDALVVSHIRESWLTVRTATDMANSDPGVLQEMLAVANSHTAGRVALKATVVAGAAVVNYTANKYIGKSLDIEEVAQHLPYGVAMAAAIHTVAKTGFGVVTADANKRLKSSINEHTTDVQQEAKRQSVEQSDDEHTQAVIAEQVRNQMTYGEQFNRILWAVVGPNNISDPNESDVLLGEITDFMSASFMLDAGVSKDGRWSRAKATVKGSAQKLAGSSEDPMAQFLGEVIGAS